MRNIFKFCDKLTVDRYYKMSNHELELEAGKYKIGEYFDGTKISRQLIIKQLLEKDIANNSRFAILISLLALMISIVSIFVNK